MLCLLGLVPKVKRRWYLKKTILVIKLGIVFLKSWGTRHLKKSSLLIIVFKQNLFISDCCGGHLSQLVKGNKIYTKSKHIAHTSDLTYCSQNTCFKPYNKINCSQLHLMIEQSLSTSFHTEIYKGVFKSGEDRKSMASKDEFGIIKIIFIRYCTNLSMQSWLYDVFT